MSLCKEMTVIEIRLHMAKLGWQSNDRLTDIGSKDGYTYSIWFERWDWHNIRVGRICIHSHTANLKDINDVVYGVAKKACDAYNTFTNSIPTQLVDGSLVDDPIQTPFYQKAILEGYNKKETIKLYETLREYIEL